MNLQELVEKRIKVVVSDPWEFEAETGTGFFYAKILRLGKEGQTNALLLQTEKPINYKNVTCEHFIASPRHEGKNIDALNEGVEVLCALTRIDPDQLEKDPFDLSNWRGGVGLIASLIITDYDN